MATMSRAGGYKTCKGNWAPAIYSQKVQVFPWASVVEAITNTDYTGKSRIWRYSEYRQRTNNYCKDYARGTVNTET